VFYWAGFRLHRGVPGRKQGSHELRQVLQSLKDTHGSAPGPQETQLATPAGIALRGAGLAPQAEDESCCRTDRMRHREPYTRAGLSTPAVQEDLAKVWANAAGLRQARVCRRTPTTGKP
jgi:hypothetical protein